MDPRIDLIMAQIKYECDSFCCFLFPDDPNSLRIMTTREQRLESARSLETDDEYLTHRLGFLYQTHLICEDEIQLVQETCRQALRIIGGFQALSWASEFLTEDERNLLKATFEYFVATLKRIPNIEIDDETPVLCGIRLYELGKDSFFKKRLYQE